MNRKGAAYPIRVSPNGRYFVDQAGEPFFWLGDTAWPLFAQYSRQEAETYLENRTARGFTVIQGVLAWGGGTGFETKAPGPNFAGEKVWLDDEPATPNDAYFQHVDALADFALENGLVLAQLLLLMLILYLIQRVKTAMILCRSLHVLIRGMFLMLPIMIL